VAALQPGSTIELVGIRAGKSFHASTQLVERPE
jgi:hypothetical protein